MLNYIIVINKDMKAIVIDYETDKKNCNPDIGYETDFEDWETKKEEYMNEFILFDSKKSFKEPGIYKVFGYDYSINTPDGEYYSYYVENIVKLSDLKY